MEKPKVKNFLIKISELKTNHLVVSILDEYILNKFMELTHEYFNSGVVSTMDSTNSFPKKIYLNVSELVDVNEFASWVTDEMDKPGVKVDNCEKVYCNDTVLHVLNPADEDAVKLFLSSILARVNGNL